MDFNSKIILKLDKTPDVTYQKTLTLLIRVLKDTEILKRQRPPSLLEKYDS
jgi:hypothetical protein